MKIKIDNIQDAQEVTKLATTLLASAFTLYTITRKAITEAGNINTTDKEALLKELDAMRLPDWDNL